jgi:hypothetical protein
MDGENENAVEAMDGESDDDKEMVGLLTQSSDPYFNETHTRQASELSGRRCEHLGCSKPIKFENMQLRRDGRATCIECFNSKYKETEFPGHEDFSKKQFQRLSHEEFLVVMNKMDPGHVKMTKRAAENPKRKQDDISLALEKLDAAKSKVIRASVDYLATIASGFQGWYCCRSKKLIQLNGTITRVKADLGAFWSTPTATQLSMHPFQKMTCSDVLLPMNHWFRGGTGKHYRCPLNFCEYHPWSTEKGDGCAFFLVLYDSDGRQHFIPATLPRGKLENKVTLLKLMFCEENLPALMADAEDVADYWKVINDICKKEYAMLSEMNLGIEVEIRMPPYKIKETRASLSEKAVGRRVKCCVIDPKKLSDTLWTDPDWEKFLDGMFANFRFDHIPETTLAGMGPAAKRLAREIARINPKNVSNKIEPISALTKDFKKSCAVAEEVIEID